MIIAPLADSLRELGPGTEEEFLALGKKLEEFTAASQRIQELVFKVAEILGASGPGADVPSVAEAEGVFRATMESLQSSERVLREQQAPMEELRNRLQGLKSVHGGIEAVGKQIRMLSINIKIESARAGRAAGGFHALAQEVSELASVVHEHGFRFQERAEAALAGVENLLAEMKEEQKLFSRQVEEMGPSLSSLLDELSIHLEHADSLARYLRDNSGAMSEGIGEVVQAMQFHDITRQQLEAVAKALQEIGDLAPLLSGESDDLDEVSRVYGIVSLQAAQLNNVYYHVQEAKNKIVKGLTAVAELSTQQAERAMEFSGAGSGGTGIVERIGDEMDRAVDGLNLTAGLMGRISDTAARTADAVAEMGEFIGRIEEIARTVKLLALNALAEATRTGSGGGPLRILAQELHNLSEDTRKNALAAVEAVRSIAEGSKRQQESAVAMLEHHEQAKDLADRAVQAARDMAGLSDELNSLLRELDVGSTSLAQEIYDFIPAIRFPEIMSASIEEAWEVLASVLDRLEERYPQVCIALREAKAAEVGYVMESQRDVHRQLAVGSGVVPGAEAVPDGGDLGDGVELF